jgi:Tol biopolymer transport system component/DNA-binding winged helix-turn-helix (wHTH) protein
MEATSQSDRMIRFGTFELDLAAGELRKGGRKVRVQEQPFQLLAALVEKPGEVVTREELKDRLWPGDTYVDFDRSLNTAASKLRDALGDSASSPRFIETLPRRGYRFLASVEPVTNGAGAALPGRSLEGARQQHRGGRVGMRELASRRMVVLAGAALVGLAIAAVAFWPRSPGPTESVSPARFSLPVEEQVRWPAVSPDGLKIAYAGGNERGHSIWIQDLKDWVPRKLSATDEGSLPFWSPDSAWVAFEQNGNLKRVAVDGGSPTVLCRLPAYFHGGTWSPDGSSIVFSAGEAGRLYKVAALGGEPQLLLATGVENGFRFPHFLPLESGGRFLLAFSGGRIGSRVHLVNLETDEYRELAEGAEALYSRSGHIVYQTARRVSGIEAVPFSLDTLQVTGAPFPIASEAWEPSVSDSGTLVYRYAAEKHVRMDWRDRAGGVLAESGVVQEQILYPVLSPDESRVAVSALGGDNIGIWVHELRRGVKTRVTSASPSDAGPLWSENSQEIVFSRNSGSETNSDVFLVRADGSGEARPLLATDWKEFATHWSADGNYILYDRSRETARNDIWYLERNGETYEPHPFIESPFDQRAAHFSPDGDHVAYVSNKSGDYEVYAADFPEGKQEWKVSEGGGISPRWSKDGGELYYVDRATLHAVPVSREREFSLGTPEVLFQASGLRGTYLPHYDVSSDGRFLVRGPSSDNPESIRVVQNWFAEFQDRPKGDE